MAIFVTMASGLSMRAPTNMVLGLDEVLVPSPVDGLPR